MAFHTVIVGGNFGGLNAAKEIEKKGGRVTVITPRDFIWVQFGGVATASRPGLIDTLMIPTDRLVTPSLGSKIVRGLATGVEPATKTVKYQPIGVDGLPAGQPASLAYDFLVLATGVHYGAPLHAGHTRTATREATSTFKAALDAAASILVVGGGVVGVELVGDLQTGWPKTPITLAHSRAELLSNPGDTFLPTFKARIASELLAIGVKLELGSRVHGLAELDTAPGVTVVVPGQVWAAAPGQVLTVTTAAGKTLSAALIVATLGGAPCTEWLQGSGLASALDKKGYIKVELSYAVKGFDGIFALGDAAATADQKSSMIIKGQAPIVAHNIAVLASKSGAAFKQGKAGGTHFGGLVTLGLDAKGKPRGLGQIPFGICGPNIVKFAVPFKKGFFADTVAGDVGYTSAEVVAYNSK